MLIGISPLIGPELLSVLYPMGHGDEIVLADAHFPGDTMGKRALRADGLCIADLLDAILPLIALDKYVESPLMIMAIVQGDVLDPLVETSYRAAVDRYWPQSPAIQRLERFAFYDRARDAYAVLMTGQTAKYGNIILKKPTTEKSAASPQRLSLPFLKKAIT